MSLKLKTVHASRNVDIHLDVNVNVNYRRCKQTKKGSDLSRSASTRFLMPVVERVVRPI